MSSINNPYKNVHGTVSWRSPSNIALVKYWGKYGNQLPKNPNISFTLSKAFTETTIHYQGKKEVDGQLSISFLFEGKENEKFKAKIVQFLSSIEVYFPFLKYLELKIESYNSFPHSTGIASSASSMSALALCLVDIENTIAGGLRPAEFIEKSSFIARLGSGSACRSIFPYISVWGKDDNIPFSSNEHAIGFEEKIHPVFKSYKDAILIVSSDEKSVSSRAGHALMDDNFFAESRYKQAKYHFDELLKALENGNLDDFGRIVEKEALTLHALMMCSDPSFILLQPNTLKIIDLIKDYRTKNNVPLYYTLDAGPNVHLLYPKENAAEVETFITNILKEYCEQGKVIYDEVGNGPIKLK
jgi:diphosphomevalonate decarboxylase